MRQNMAKPGDGRETQSPEEAAAETKEPAEAARVRAEDDAETRARQDQADRTLEDGGARLRQTKAALRERERELARTGQITREVAENAADLRAQTAQIMEEARRSKPRPDSDAARAKPEINDQPE
jgi:hypothetical protein